MLLQRTDQALHTTGLLDQLADDSNHRTGRRLSRAIRLPLA
jgi:hypothetical protein